MVKTQIVPQVEASIRSQFSRERILWRGVPDPASAYRAALPALLFAIPWTAFCIVWEVLAMNEAFRLVSRGRGLEFTTWIMPLWGIPFLLIGLAMFSAPWYAARRARKTVLLLTDERLAAVYETRGRIVTRFTPFFEITTVEVTERSDGLGHIKLVRGKGRDSDGDAVERAETYEHVRDVRRLETMLRDAIRAQRPST
ncbi:MAG: hypothetical protein KGP27_05375 [Hyphomicrobiales bacterium]|nr:hypothetical protein [Hyphomicrobiales bacterium]